MARPLTKCDKNGVRYARPRAVEIGIEGALEVDLLKRYPAKELTSCPVSRVVGNSKNQGLS